MSRIMKLLAAVLALSMLASACGDDDGTAASGGIPTVVVTTNILGDVVTQLAGGTVEVVTIMPVGADPHDFQASAQQAVACLLYTSPSPRDRQKSRMPSSA